tara:strand:+ start:1061 stop:1783 length:723 start_codon:yes stop_codon:yes gene_type:complete
MAFQTGTQVDPRLMKADYSGFARAGEIQAQGMQNLTAGITDGVKKFAKKKEKKKADTSATELLVRFGGSNPQLAEGLGLDYLDPEGNYSEDILRKSSKEFVNTVGAGEIGNTIIATLGLGVKSQSSAAELGSQQREEKYDTAGFQKLVQIVNSMPDLYRMDDKNGNQITLRKTGLPLTPDMPEAEPFLNARGSGFFGLYNREAPTPALSVGGGATPTGEVLEQDGVQYSKYSDGSYRPNN